MSSVREARALMALARTWQGEGQSAALLTLVGVKGSAYRRPGAKMVMASSGRMRGTLSGGCLEGDLFLHAEQVMKNGMPVVRHYDLTEDEMWGLGIGCKGQVDIWIEPLDFRDAFWSEFTDALADEQSVIWGGRLPEGARYFASVDQTWHLKGTALAPIDWQAALAAGGQTGYLGNDWWDIMRPPERLILAGAGHDARPVAQLALKAGFDVVVLDPRSHVNTEEYFPSASHLVKNAADVSPDDVQESFWVIMNHHQRRDEEILKLASTSRPRFLGVLGPKARTDEMIEKTGIVSDVLPLHAPVGLDIGAESPEEVAVSIVSELMARRSGTRGGSLHGQPRIHR